MARILYAWELGSGMGHLIPQRPVLEALAADGHEVMVAAANLRSASEALGHLATTVVQAPVVVDARFPLGRPAESGADLLALNGFLDPVSLRSRHQAWCALARLLKADLVFAQHSPGALLMARALGLPAVHAGTGFSLPPEHRPILFPGFSDGDNLSREERLLERFNALINADGGVPLDRLCDLYNQLAGRFLMTFAELDHLGPRDGVPYLGAPVPEHGDVPEWPVQGPRLFAYLKPFAGLERFLSAVRDLKLPLLMVADGVAPALLQRHAASHVRVVNRRQNMRAVVDRADLLISNGNHGTAVAGLLGGRPMLAFPRHQEQEFCARRMVAAGLGRMLLGSDNQALSTVLDKLLHDPIQQSVNERASRRYADFDYRQSVAAMVSVTGKLL